MNLVIQAAELLRAANGQHSTNESEELRRLRNAIQEALLRLDAERLGGSNNGRR